MPYEEIDLGLNLTIPTNGTRNWGSTIKQTTWTKISQHTHTGDGDGAKLVTESYTDGSITGDKLSENIALSQYLTVNTVSANSVSLDMDNGVTQYIDLDGATGTVSVTITNAIQGATYRFLVIQGATAYGMNWSSSQVFSWQGGIAHGSVDDVTDPSTISTGNNELDMVIVYCGRNPPASTDVFYASFVLNFS